MGSGHGCRFRCSHFLMSTLLFLGNLTGTTRSWFPTLNELLHFTQFFQFCCCLTLKPDICSPEETLGTVQHIIYIEISKLTHADCCFQGRTSTPSPHPLCLPQAMASEKSVSKALFAQWLASRHATKAHKQLLCPPVKCKLKQSSASSLHCAKEEEEVRVPLKQDLQ